MEYEEEFVWRSKDMALVIVFNHMHNLMKLISSHG